MALYLFSNTTEMATDAFCRFSIPDKKIARMNRPKKSQNVLEKYSEPDLISSL